MFTNKNKSSIENILFLIEDLFYNAATMPFIIEFQVVRLVSLFTKTESILKHKILLSKGYTTLWFRNQSEEHCNPLSTYNLDRSTVRLPFSIGSDRTGNSPEIPPYLWCVIFSDVKIDENIDNRLVNINKTFIDYTNVFGIIKITSWKTQK